MRFLMLGAICAMTYCGVAAAQVPSATPAQRRSPPPVHADPLLDPVTERSLVTFRSDRDFERYVERVGRIRQQRRDRYQSSVRATPRRMAFQDAAEEPECPPEDPGCAGDMSDNIVVTGSAVSAPVSITNVQTSGVDEGDVVKQIGDFLLVLQDGRIFSVDMRGGGLRYADRIDVYRDADDDDAWYDEMLVEGQRVLITAYNYRQNATEISVFKLDVETGRLSRDGSFLISSEDYYDSDNYATRIIGDQLIIYTPYDADDFTERSQRPRVRRWMSRTEQYAGSSWLDPRASGRDLLDARNIYRPLLRTLSPTVHTITQCQLGAYRADRAPPCRATAFAGPDTAEMFVAPDAVYLWVGAGSQDFNFNGYSYRTGTCPADAISFDDIAPAVVYRLPVEGGAPEVVGLRGRPFDQFSMDETRRTFRMLLDWQRQGCWRDDDDGVGRPVAFVNVPLREFGTELREISERRHIRVPSPGEGRVENRFADDWLVYGGRRYGYGAIPDPEDMSDEEKARGPGRPVVVLPVADPATAREVMLDHNVIRIERVGADRMAINGYRDTSGLSISLMQLGGAPHILDTALLDRRYESEGRSHAFNASVGVDRSGLIGIPTVIRSGDGDRYYWRSDGSDVSFLTVASNGSLGDAGALIQGLKEPVAGYTCEVSCIDWYGNSRPIFTGGRIFALMATEIAEGRVVDGRIEEVRRVNLTGPTPPR